MGNLGFSNTQPLLVWVPGATAHYVLAQQGVMCFQAPGNCSLKLLVTYLCLLYLDDAAVNFPLQANGFWRKVGLKKPHLAGFMFAVENVLFSYENTIYGNLSLSML